MKPIKAWLQNMPETEERLKKRRDALRHEPEVQRFLSMYSEISEEAFDRAALRIEQYVAEKQNCACCPGLDRCPNMVVGYQSGLTYQAPYVQITYKKCPLLLAKEDEERRVRLIRSHYIPREIIEASFEEIERDSERIDAINEVMAFCLNYRVGTRMPGLYLYGPFGVGKSHMMGAACHVLADRGISSMMVYLPEFFREIKEAIQEGSVQEKIEVLKSVPVLILDDIGAESVSAWIRDEVLGAILQSRMSDGLPTLYTSNFSYDELEEHMALSYKGGVEEVKAKRIMERIRYETKTCYVGGPNRRRDKWR